MTSQKIANSRRVYAIDFYSFHASPDKVEVKGTSYRLTPLDEHRRQLSKFNNFSLSKKNRLRKLQRGWHQVMTGKRECSHEPK